MIVVNIQTYGDFDMPGTVLTMVAPAAMSKKIAQTLKKEAEEMFKDTNDVDGVIAYLKDWNFTTCNMLNITIGGNL